MQTYIYFIWYIQNKKANADIVYSQNKTYYTLMTKLPYGLKIIYINIYIYSKAKQVPHALKYEFN